MVKTHAGLRVFGLLVVMTLCWPTPMKSEGSSAPQSTDAFVRATSKDLVVTLKLTPVSDANSLERQIKRTASEIDSAAGLTTAIWLCHGCGGASSHPSLGIIVDVEQLSSISKQVEIKKLSTVIAFVIAHEIAHQSQFRENPKMMDSLALEEREAFEAQADVLAGKYLVDRMNSLKNAKLTDENVIVQSLVFDLGVERYALADHPSQEGRLNSVRLGMGRGIVSQLLAEKNATGTNIAAALDVRTGESLQEWSLRIAKRAINYRRPDILGLVLTDKKIKWDSSNKNPIVSYELTYENRGDRAIEVDLTVQSISAARDDQTDMLKWELYAANSGSMVIEPKYSRTISGTLHWYATDKLMPLLVIPTDRGGLLAVRYLTPDSTSVSNGNNSAMKLVAETPNTPSFEYVLDRLIGSSGEDFSSLRGGPGTKYNDRVAYPCDPQFPGSYSTIVYVPEYGSTILPYVSGTLLRTNHGDEAKAKYNATVAEVRGSLQKLGKWDDGTVTIARHEFVNHRLTVTVIETGVDEYYYVRVEIKENARPLTGQEVPAPGADSTSDQRSDRSNTSSLSSKDSSQLCGDLKRFIGSALGNFSSVRGRLDPDTEGQGFYPRGKIAGFGDCTVWIYHDRSLDPTVICNSTGGDVHTLRDPVQSCLGSQWTATTESDGNVDFDGPHALSVRLVTHRRGVTELWIVSPTRN